MGYTRTANLDDTEGIPASSDDAKEFAKARLHMTHNELYSQFGNYYTVQPLGGVATQQLITHLDQTLHENSLTLEA